MFLMLETIIILLYLINSKIAFFAMLFSTIYMFVIYKKNFSIVCLLKLLIMSLPMSFISVLGESFHHLFSWYNIFLIFFILYFIVKKYKVSRLSILSIFILIFIFFIELYFSHDKLKSIIEILQIFAMIIPIILVSNMKEKIPIKLSEIKNLIFNYSDVCLATAISMIVQYILYNHYNMIVGFVKILGANRVDFYGLFRGASILPIFMGIGFIILLIDVLNNKISINVIIKMLIIFIAMILNSSRSGFFALIVISTIIFMSSMFKNINRKTIFLIILFFIGTIIGINYLTKIRVSLNSFLDDNGRFEGWKNGIIIWTSSFKNFLFGEGFSGGLWNYYYEPHNLIIQSLSQCGILVTIMIIIMFIKFLNDNKKNIYKYLIWFVIITGMLVTDFYANSFTTIILILVDLYGTKSISIQNKNSEVN